jgi:hypothetical protein
MRTALLKRLKAFRLLVNHSVTWASWDEELLALELQELTDADFDLDSKFKSGRLTAWSFTPAIPVRTTLSSIACAAAFASSASRFQCLPAAMGRSWTGTNCAPENVEVENILGVRLQIQAVENGLVVADIVE